MSQDDPGRRMIPSPVENPGPDDADFENRHGHLTVTNPEAYLNLVNLRDKRPGKYREYLKMEKDRFLDMHRFLKNSGPQNLLEYHVLVNLFNTDRRGYAMKIKSNPELVDECHRDDADDIIREVFGEHAVPRTGLTGAHNQEVSPRQREVQRRTRVSQFTEIIAIIIIGFIILGVSFVVLTDVDTHLSGVIHGLIIAVTVQLSVSRIMTVNKKQHTV